jgi:hypothetical protein
MADDDLTSEIGKGFSNTNRLFPSCTGDGAGAEKGYKTPQIQPRRLFRNAMMIIFAAGPKA